MRWVLLITTLICSSLIVCSQETNHAQGVYKFLENKGQWPNQVLFKTDLHGGKIWLEKTGILYQFLDLSGVEKIHHHEDSKLSDTLIKQHLLYASFEGANSDFTIEKKYPTTEYYNFFIGDKTKWASEVYGYNHITYKNIYDNTDLLFLEKNGELKYEFHLQPNGKPQQINIKYSGAEKISINNDGELRIKTSLGEIIEQKPYAYQIKNGKITEVPCNFLLKDNVVSFELGKYDTKLELIIDPVLIFATYNGAVSDNFGMTATYGYDGTAYSGGTLYGNDYPTPAPVYNDLTNFTGPSSAAYGITDVFISKYSDDGTSMLWTSFIGGGDNTQGTETVHSLICDSLNNVYFFGATSSSDFPMQNAYQPTHAGGTANSNYLFNGVYYTNQGTDIFVAKLNANGTTLMGSTYVGGSGNDGINYRIAGGFYTNSASYDSLTSNYGDQFRGEIMLDSMNNILIASSTRSINFPVSNSFQSTLGGQQDGVIFKLSSDFSTMLWSSYFGGTQNDACYSVKLDSDQNIFVAGGTSSSNIPGSTGGLNPTYLGGKSDGFIFRVSSDGNNLEQSTYIGSNTYDQVFFLETDDTGAVYILGSSSGIIPITPGVYSTPGSGQFIQKISGDLTSLSYSTVFGNGSINPQLSPSAFCIDECGNIYASGWGANILQPTPLNGMPVTPDAFQISPPDGFDFYLIALERDALSLKYGSYIGSPNSNEHIDGGTSRFDAYGILYQSICGGCGGDDNFPTSPNAWSNVNNSANCNNVVLKFDFEIFPKVDFDATLTGCAPFTTTFTNQSNDTVNSVWIFDAGATIISGGANPTVLFDSPGVYQVTLSLTDSVCNKTFTKTEYVIVDTYPNYQMSNDTTVCPGDGPINLTANSFGSANTFTWDDNIDFSSPISIDLVDSVVTVNPGVTTTFYLLISSGTCIVIDSVIVQVGCLDIINSEKPGISIYPNPFGEYTTLYFGDDMHGTYNILIYDAQGKVTYQNQNYSGKELQINRHKMSAGVYVISVVDAYTEQEIFNTSLIIE